MRLISFKPVIKGSLRGFCSIDWPAAGLVLKDVSIHVSKTGKAWAGLPAAPVIDSEGHHHVVDGKKQYHPLIEWKDRDRSDRFSASVVELVRAKHPDALDDADKLLP
jgi:hypothetical protein